MIEEDLVFNYIEKTIFNDNSVNSPSYMMILENALSLNPQKTCSYFSSEAGSFQVLNSTNLKKFYCKKCLDYNP
jgi:hypothetical protein